MSGISFIVTTAGSNDTVLLEIIDSIERTNIPQYEIIIVGGLTTTVNRKNTFHIPFDETQTPTAWLTRKKNLGVQASKYEVAVVMHDYHVFDPDWYYEFEKFGTDWDILVHPIYHSAAQNSVRGNGWRVGQIPGYPEIPFCMTIPWDIDCFVPYMAIQGSYWIIKRDVMLANPLNENLLWGQSDDIEWSSRVVPGWQGQAASNCLKIATNPKCIVRFNKIKDTYPGNPDWAAIEKHFEPLWNFLRAGGRRSGVYHYDSSAKTVTLAP